ncbi:MFS general substrate transporter [Mycena belliarum]|uniref:MFS general substrate transporter n=1 Tax=Mycena belliarum TaxID=1033014 RepID=A0AAD6UA82_9AGAR|nr:MFS general substrate transporter [Mycena belliae]
MADLVNEKDYNSSDDGSGTTRSPEIFERPKGFRGFYTHPTTQVAMLGLVCFMCPGLFNALSGIGGGGQLDVTTAANGNVALYSTFTVMAFFAGSINNKLGARLTLQIGSLGYGLYIASFLALNIHPGAKAFVLAAGAILGVCAGLLWTAQGSLMMAYPTEGDKAKYIAIFWAIFNLGGVVGSAVAFGNNFHTSAGSVNNGTYIGFLILTIIGALIPLFMVDPKHIIRSDGTKLTVPLNPSWRVEILGLYVALKTDPMIILLFPMFFASNWFYAWQFNDYNGALFNIRTRSLNSMLYWSSQVLGAMMMAFILDKKNVTRRTRAFIGWGVVLVLVFVVHGWGYAYQKYLSLRLFTGLLMHGNRTFTRASLAAIAPADRIDIHDKEYVGKVFLYIFFGLLDSAWQTNVYWLMGAMSNDPAKLAYFTGFYKSIQSAGAVGSWRADAVLTPYMNMFASTWGLSVAGLVFALPMIYLRVREHTDMEDETVARMDDDGHVLPSAEVAAQQPEKKAEA